MMRKALMTAVDVGLVGLATCAALFVRYEFEIGPLLAPNPFNYVLATMGVTLVVHVLFGVNRAIWRFTSLAELMRLALVCATVVAATTMIVFAANRLENVPRSVPILQFLLMVAVLAIARAAVQGWHARRASQPRMAAAVAQQAEANVLVVGVNALTELYLRSAEDMAADRVHIAGLVDRNDRRQNRSLRQYEVLGPIENTRSIMRNLETHGVVVNRIVVTEPMARLAPAALAELIDIESTMDVQVDFLAEKLFGESQGSAVAALDAGRGASSSCAARREPPAQGWYPTAKRAIDCIGALALILLLAPVFAPVYLLVAATIGTPVMFWQRRPGMHGRNFKLYKFRTMGPAHGSDGRKLSDAERMSRVGALLRNTRLDELPQLFSILAGEMSFVGPRPLLPVDQPADSYLRLAVRPGLTGWAQVNGGRLVSPEDKGAMDIYYVEKMSLLLDLKVVAKTVPMVLFREKANHEAVREAWQHLHGAGAKAPA